MWKYTHTDEMYHSLVNRNNSTELFHSDVYLGQEYSDGLRHFKYLKRERKNGKWVYYYSNEELKKASIQKNVAQLDYKRAKAAAKRAEEDNDEKQTRAGTANLAYQFSKIPDKGLIKNINRKIKNKQLEKIRAKTFKEADEAEKVKNQTAERAKKAAKTMYEFEDNYDKVEKKTKVHRAVGESLAKAANKLSDASYNTKKAVEKGKKKVNKALKKIKDKVYNDEHKVETHAMTNFNYVNDTKKKSTNKVDDTKKKKKKSSKPKKTYLVK